MLNPKLKPLIMSLAKEGIANTGIQIILREIENERVLTKDAVIDAVKNRMILPLKDKDFISELEKI